MVSAVRAAGWSWVALTVVLPLTLGPAASSGLAATAMAVAAAFHAIGAVRARDERRAARALLVPAFTLWALIHGIEAAGLAYGGTTVNTIGMVGWAFALGGFVLFRNAALGGDREQVRRTVRSLRLEQAVAAAVALLAVWEIALMPFRAGNSLLWLASWLSSSALGLTTALVACLPIAVAARGLEHRWLPLAASTVAFGADVATTTAMLIDGGPDYRLFAGWFGVAILLMTRVTCDPRPLEPPSVYQQAALLDSFRLIVVVAAVAAIPLITAVTVIIGTDLEPRGLVLAGTVIAGGVAVRLRSALRRAGEVHDALHQRAVADELTGLPNRRGLQERWRSERRADTEDHPVSVLFVDLDGFKAVNDTLGHAAGDELLRQVAARLSANVRAEDVVARLGGDEFVVVGAYHRHDAGELGERLIAVLCEPFDIGGARATIGASIGLAEQAPDEPIDITLSRADGAMYAAKRAGKGRLVHVA